MKYSIRKGGLEGTRTWTLSWRWWRNGWKKGENIVICC